MPPWPRSLGRRNLPSRRGMRAWIPRSVVACSEPERAASPGHLRKQSRDSNSALEQESEWWVPGGGQNLPAGPGDKLCFRLAPVLSAPCGAATGSRIQNMPSPGQSPCWPLCSPSCHVLNVLARPPREPWVPFRGLPLSAWLFIPASSQSRLDPRQERLQAQALPAAPRLQNLKVAAPEARHFYLHEKAGAECKIVCDLILKEKDKNKSNCVLVLPQFSCWPFPFVLPAFLESWLTLI